MVGPLVPCSKSCVNLPLTQPVLVWTDCGGLGRRERPRESLVDAFDVQERLDRNVKVEPAAVIARQAQHGDGLHMSRRRTELSVASRRAGTCNERYRTKESWYRNIVRRSSMFLEHQGQYRSIGSSTVLEIPGTSER